MATLDQFRKRVVAHSLFAPCRLGEAIQRLGFVQAYPIRSPARAQDLILRHRVKNYRAGDLEHTYPSLGLEECFLYAYGFMPKDLWRVVHPRTDEALTPAQKDTLRLIERHGPMLPKDLEAHVGGERVRNYWGGFSRSAKMAMEALHGCGALRVARRDKGIRVYGVAEVFEQTLPNEQRFKHIAVAALMLMGATRKLGYYAMPVLWRDWVVGWANACVEKGDLVVDFEYVESRPRDRGYREAAEQDVARLAAFLGLEQDRWKASI